MFLTEGAFHHQPYRFVRKALFTQHHLPLGKLILDRPFGPFRDFPPIPETIMDAFGQALDRDGSLLRLSHHPFRALFSLIRGSLWLGHRSLSPTAGLGWNRYEIDLATALLCGFNKFRTIPLETLRHNVLERQHVLLVN